MAGDQLRGLCLQTLGPGEPACGQSQPWYQHQPGMPGRRRRIIIIINGLINESNGKVQGSPSPAVRWVRAGRILANLSSPLQSNVPELKYIIREHSTAVGQILILLVVLIIIN